jgi:mRNA-degrading endonuclease HigB of HigAB toxin-antitoxin module
MISVNDILMSYDEKNEYRVLWISKEHDIAYVFELAGDGMPIAMSLKNVEQQLSDGVMIRQEEDKYWQTVPEHEISEKDKAIRDSIWSIMEKLVLQEPAIYERKQRGQLITEAETTGVPRKSLYRHLKRYWQRGKNKNAFLPNYHNCGGKGKERISQSQKTGRPRKYGETTGKNVDEATKQIFEQAIKKYYHTRQEHSLKAAYELMIKEFYTKPVDLPDGTTRFELLDANELPTLRQFRYWYSKKYDAKDKLTSRKGQAKYDLNHRAVLGKSDANIRGPGSQYQIDATVGDIYLVSRFNRANIIGRPVIYFIIDVFSRMVAGMYVGLEGPSWTGAMMALANAAMDKVAFCETYGITITYEQWPCHHIPDTILADRGEMESKSVETLINTLNIRVDNAPAYRADMKGIVEQFFRTVNTKTTVFLPGHVKPDMAQRGGKDYRLDAKLDIYQFTKIMIQCVLNHNNVHFLEGYERTADMIVDDVEPIPIKLWEWGIAHCSGQLRSVTEDTIKLCLMPVDTALVTAKGIRFKGLYYLSERAIYEHWFETARARGSYKVDISYDPRDMGSIYVRNLDGRLFEKCYLAEWESKWNGKYLDEVIYQQTADRKMRNQDINRELQARVDLNTEIEKIVEEAEQMAKQTVIPSSKRERISHIRENRAGEKQAIRQEEAFVLGEELQTPPIEQAKPEEPISPTLAMIKRKLEERLNEKK